MFYELIVLGLACLGAPICARLAGFETHRKPFDLVGAGGIFFLLGSSFKLAGELFTTMTVLNQSLMMGAFCLGWLGLLIGAFWVAVEVFREADHGVLHKGGV